ncbi:hypothetical protein JCM10212_000479 [Sporobolomyces blumeae]
MRNRKSNAALRQAASPSTASPASPVDAHFPPTPTATTFASSSNSPYDAAEFDRFMKGGANATSEGHDASAPSTSNAKNSRGKKLLSFPWSRSDKKPSMQSQSSPILSPTTISSPVLATFKTTSSLPLGFPTPPASDASRAKSAPQQHPCATAVPSSSQAFSHQESNSSLSTYRTTSSFASTALFASSNEGWDSEATSLSLTSSPESGRDSCGEAMPQRMWRVKHSPAEQLDPVREEEETRSLRYSVDGRRNSTPIPCMVAAMLADPETPPRPKRFSTSSKPSPSSPPFDPAYEQAAARRRQESERRSEQGSGASPGSNGDADDEVSPPRSKGRLFRRDWSDDALLANPTFSSKTRIPSIRFEGLSMDAVFAEVEKKMNGEGGSNLGESATAQADKKARRRSHVLSLYMPTTYTFDDEPALPPSPSPSSAPQTTDPIRSGSVTPTSAADLGRPRPIPRRTSSRPSPVNVVAANTVVGGPASAPVFGTSAPLSPSSPQAPAWQDPFSAASSRAATPDQLASPPLSGSFSPSSQTFAGPAGLGEPFVQSSSPSPSPALSSTSTFRPCEIPEVCIFPPSPEQRSRNSGLSSGLSSRRSSEPSPPVTIVTGPTKVTLVHEKRVVRVSTRAPSKKSERQRMFTPPSITVGSPSSRPASPARPPPLDLAATRDVATPPLSPSLDSPTIPAFYSIPYNPPTVARTDFHPALSSLAVEAQPIDDDSSDCEETLNHMLMRLQRPHTPPGADSAPAATSLTENALQIHTASQSRLSMIARGLNSNDLSSSPSSNYSLSSLARGAGKENENISPLSVRRMHRKSRVYESDDSATRYGDAPLSIAVPHSLSRTPSQRAVVEVYSEADDDSSDEFAAAAKQAQVDLEKEIDDTLASIVGSTSASTFSLSSASSASSPPPPLAKSHRRNQNDSISSTSSFPFTDESPGSGESSTSSSDLRTEEQEDKGDATRSTLPHSESYGSNLTCDSFDSASTETETETEGEEAIVCLGERIECNYNVGVIGMAM